MELWKGVLQIGLSFSFLLSSCSLDRDADSSGSSSSTSIIDQLANGFSRITGQIKRPFSVFLYHLICHYFSEIKLSCTPFVGQVGG